MAVTISYYQALGSPFTISAPAGGNNDNKHVIWDPSNDFFRDETFNNACVLFWTCDPLEENNLDMSIEIDGNGVFEIENMGLDGVRRIVTTQFLSNKAVIGNNTFTFRIRSGSGRVTISDYVIFYKRKVLV